MFVATQQMFLQLSRFPFVPPRFLLFSFVLCLVVVVLFVFFPFLSLSFSSRAVGIVHFFVSNGFGDTSELSELIFFRRLADMRK